MAIRIDSRVGLGMLRLADADVAATVEAALDAGIACFDTARAYGESERLLGIALQHHPSAFVMTKGGMARPDGKWRADGRAAQLRRDCEASLTALGRPIDLYLVHAPDPAVKWATTVRALGKLADEKMVRAIGVCNVSLAQLDEALSLAPLGAVQVALNLLDDNALRSGVLERCRQRGLLLIAHSPLGGPRRKNALLSSPLLVELAARHKVAAAALALGALLDAHPEVVVIPGARGPDRVRQFAAPVQLDDDERARLRKEFASLRARVVVPAETIDGEVVLVMGLPGAGKSRAARPWTEQGYERLNRDKMGGTLAQLAERLDQRLKAGARRLVLDNTYLTRAQRAQILAIAARHRVEVRGLFIDVPMVEAQHNVILRMLAAHSILLSPEELRRGRDNTTLAPTSLWRLARSVEPPVADEGFASLEVRPFIRESKRSGAGARFVTHDCLERAGDLSQSFVIGWAPDAPATLESQLAARCAGVALCRHGGGPPICWCRPPLPGLLLALAHTHAIDLQNSELWGKSAAHRALAAAVGARFVATSS